MTVTSPKQFADSGLLDSWLEAWSIAASGVADCWTAAARQGPWSLDLGRWAQLAYVRGEPGWSSPNRVILEAPVARLRDFSTRSKGGPIPTLVLPPQAGHSSSIVDYSSTQSQMQTIISAGLDRAYSMEWLGATPETANATIDDYLDVIDRAVEHCGGRVNLIGDCQGGWLATIYAALAPESVNTLTLAGAPIDFHAGEPVIHEVLRHLAPGGDLRFYEGLVKADGGVLKGEHMLAGFILIQPGDEISRQVALLLNLDDPAHVARYSEFEDWFKHTQDMPGPFYLWIVEHLFRDNALVSGELRVRGQRVELSNLSMPLNLLAGATDHITPPDQVFAIASLASTPPDQVMRDVTAGGHLGLFMGHESLRDHWPPLLAEILRHST
jgi:poly(3-hydroxybutyrate) depolymerase